MGFNSGFKGLISALGGGEGSATHSGRFIAAGKRPSVFLNSRLRGSGPIWNQDTSDVQLKVKVKFTL